MYQRLEEKYKKDVIPAMKEMFGYSNVAASPKIEKVVLNIGAGKVLLDPNFMDIAVETLRRITGQEPIKTRAKKSISNFKIREGLAIGAKVTLRGKRMYDFLDKFMGT